VSTTDDLTLVERTRRGDRQAFRLLVQRYERKVYALAYGMLKNPEDAKDASQESFAKAYRSLEHFKGDASFYTWIYRICSNICIDAIRRRGGGRGDMVEFDESVENDSTAAHSVSLSSQLGQNPQKAALRRELAEKIQEALAQLPEKHRAILLLREVDGMSYEDLSRTLEVPKGTVMSRLFHARSKVQKILSEYLGLEGASSSLGEE
jgi:RNA polymerase sigma-70 factor (ECF subfamily)